MLTGFTLLLQFVILFSNYIILLQSRNFKQTSVFIVVSAQVTSLSDRTRAKHTLFIVT